MGAAHPFLTKGLFHMKQPSLIDDRISAIDRRLPYSVRKVAGLAVRIAATRDGAPLCCSRRACRKDGRCRADYYGHEGAVCTGRPPNRAADEVAAMSLGAAEI